MIIRCRMEALKRDTKQRRLLIPMPVLGDILINAALLDIETHFCVLNMGIRR